jgi:hypothetical protein
MLRRRTAVGSGLSSLSGLSGLMGTSGILPPTVDSLSISSGTLAGNNFVTLTGTSFTGATAVHFGTKQALWFVVVNSTTILCAPAPRTSTGIVNITVTTAGGTSATGAGNAYTFTSVAVTGTTITYNQSGTISVYDYASICDGNNDGFIWGTAYDLAEINSLLIKTDKATGIPTVVATLGFGGAGLVLAPDGTFKSVQSADNSFTTFAVYTIHTDGSQSNHIFGTTLTSVWIGPDGLVWVTDDSGGDITNSGVWKETALNTWVFYANASFPIQGCCGPDGNSYVIDQNDIADSCPVWRVTTSGVWTKLADIPACSAPMSIALGGDGNLYVSGLDVLGTNVVTWQLKMDGTVTVVLTTGTSAPYVQVAGPDGRVFLFNNGVNPANCWDGMELSAFAVVPYPVTPAGNTTTICVSKSDGMLWLGGLNGLIFATVP